MLWFVDWFQIFSSSRAPSKSNKSSSSALPGEEKPDILLRGMEAKENVQSLRNKGSKNVQEKRRKVRLPAFADRTTVADAVSETNIHALHESEAQVTKVFNPAEQKEIEVIDLDEVKSVKQQETGSAADVFSPTETIHISIGNGNMRSTVVVAKSPEEPEVCEDLEIRPPQINTQESKHAVDTAQEQGNHSVGSVEEKNVKKSEQKQKDLKDADKVTPKEKSPEKSTERRRRSSERNVKSSRSDNTRDKHESTSRSNTRRDDRDDRDSRQSTYRRSPIRGSRSESRPYRSTEFDKRRGNTGWRDNNRRNSFDGRRNFQSGNRFNDTRYNRDNRGGRNTDRRYSGNDRDQDRDRSRNNDRSRESSRTRDSRLKGKTDSKPKVEKNKKDQKNDDIEILSPAEREKAKAELKKIDLILEIQKAKKKSKGKDKQAETKASMFVESAAINVAIHSCGNSPETSELKQGDVEITDLPNKQSDVKPTDETEIVLENNETRLDNTGNRQSTTGRIPQIGSVKEKTRHVSMTTEKNMPVSSVSEKNRHVSVTALHVSTTGDECSTATVSSTNDRKSVVSAATEGKRNVIPDKAPSYPAVDDSTENNNKTVVEDVSDAMSDPENLQMEQTSDEQHLESVNKESEENFNEPVDGTSSEVNSSSEEENKKKKKKKCKKKKKLKKKVEVSSSSEEESGNEVEESGNEVEESGNEVESEQQQQASDKEDADNPIGEEQEQDNIKQSSSEGSGVESSNKTTSSDNTSEDSDDSDEEEESSEEESDSSESEPVKKKKRKKRSRKKKKKKRKERSESDSSSEDESEDSEQSSKKKRKKHKKKKKRKSKHSRKKKKGGEDNKPVIVDKKELAAWFEQEKERMRKEILQEIQQSIAVPNKNIAVRAKKEEVEESLDGQDAEIAISADEMKIEMGTQHGFPTGIPLSKDAEDLAESTDGKDSKDEDEIFSLFKSDDDLDFDDSEGEEANWKRRTSREKDQPKKPEDEGRKREREQHGERHRNERTKVRNRGSSPKKQADGTRDLSKKPGNELKDTTGRNKAVERTRERKRSTEHRVDDTSKKSRPVTSNKERESSTAKVDLNRHKPISAAHQTTQHEKDLAANRGTDRYHSTDTRLPLTKEFPRFYASADTKRTSTDGSKMNTTPVDGIAIANKVRDDVYKLDDFWKGDATVSRKRSVGENIFKEKREITNNVKNETNIDSRRAPSEPTTTSQSIGHWEAPFSDVQNRLRKIADPNFKNKSPVEQESKYHRRPTEDEKNAASTGNKRILPDNDRIRTEKDHHHVDKKESVSDNRRKKVEESKVTAAVAAAEEDRRYNEDKR